jgi:diaminopimelate decarboxylase
MSVVLADASAAPKIGGLDPEELASRFGTPLYVYDFDVIEGRVAALRAALPDSFDLAYAVKANPSLGVVGHLARLGLGADVASGGELATALRAGIDPGRIVFTGPGKRGDELEAAARAGIRAVTVESIGELRRLDDVASRLETTTPVLLRVAVAGRPETTGVAIGRADGGKFGIDLQDLTEAAVFALRSRYLRLLGLHAFGASNVLDADAIADHVDWTVRTATEMTRRLRAETGISSALELVDVGGGLGIPYRDEDAELDLARLGDRLARLASAWSDADETRGMQILVEPGRFLVGPAGTYLTRVVDTKRIAGRDVVILDGGIHHLVRPALVGGAHRIANLSDRELGQRRVTVAGPLCSALDVFGDDVVIGPPAVGELLAIFDTGAYGYTESMPLFLSHPVPAEIAISCGRVGLLRDRIEPAAWLAAQRLPAW